MPDLTIEIYYHCQSAEDFSMDIPGSKGKTHKVTYGPARHGPYEYDYSCTCHAFKFGKGKPCKHIEEVKKSGKHCKWMQFLEGGKVAEKDGQKVCPNCGLPAHPQRYGV